MPTIKGKSVINLSVITLSDGQKMNTVKDLIYDPVENKVKAFLVDHGGWFKGAKVIYIDDVASIGADAMTILRSDLIKPLNEVEEKVSSIVNNGNKITNDEVYTYDGNKIGKVVDIHFDIPSGEVKYLEISQGVASILSGTKLIAIGDILTIGKNKIIVKNSAETDVNNQAENQGVNGLINSTKDKLGEATNAVKDQGSSLASGIKEKASEVSAIVAEKISENTTDSSQATKTEQNNYATLPPVVNQAENAVEDVTAGTKEVGEKAKKIGLDIVSNVKDYMAVANKSIEDKRISGAIGKIVTNTAILSMSDEILAKPGDIITHELVEKANANGKLDQLLNNVGNLETA